MDSQTQAQITDLLHQLWIIANGECDSSDEQLLLGIKVRNSPNDLAAIRRLVNFLEERQHA